MENGTIFEAAREIVRKETVSYSIKQFNNYINSKSDQSVKKESASRDKSSRKK